MLRPCSGQDPAPDPTHPLHPRGRVGTFPDSRQVRRDGFAMHYPHKSSRIKKVRKVGFRARMRTSKGRRIINRRRRLGRRPVTTS